MARRRGDKKRMGTEQRMDRYIEKRERDGDRKNERQTEKRGSDGNKSSVCKYTTFNYYGKWLY